MLIWQNIVTHSLRIHVTIQILSNRCGLNIFAGCCQCTMVILTMVQFKVEAKLHDEAHAPYLNLRCVHTEHNLSDPSPCRVSVQLRSGTTRCDQISCDATDVIWATWSHPGWRMPAPLSQQTGTLGVTIWTLSQATVLGRWSWNFWTFQATLSLWSSFTLTLTLNAFLMFFYIYLGRTMTIFTSVLAVWQHQGRLLDFIISHVCILTVWVQQVFTRTGNHLPCFTFVALQ